MSFVDLNRTGVALMEIVSRPAIRGPEEAAAYVGKQRQIMRYLGTCDGNMQNGNLRADVNVSVCLPGQYEKYRETGDFGHLGTCDGNMQNGNLRADVNVSICRPGAYEKYMETQDFSHLGTRCEIKNMNSMRFIQAAIEVEARRQIAIVEAGGKVDQETRLYDPDKNETRSMRSKEEAHDYRYFPDPDLLPLEIEQGWVDDIAKSLPELPDEKKARFVNDFGLSEYDASVLTAEAENAAYFEAVAEGRNGKLAANWVINELFGRLKKEDHDITETPISPAQLGGIIDLISSDAISGKIAKDLFEIVYTEGGDPAQIVEERGMKQVTDTGAIEAALDEIIAANPAQVEKAKVNPKLAGWFVGQVMKATGGKANPKAVNQLVAQKLNS
jgi:aspartyl-tRNA(Asn)/glutamyl-tRNA(Gln) amidotransferase subunit B